MNSAIAGRFPLMNRSRPLGLPLPTRITALAEPFVGIDGAGHHEQVARASSVINLAALIASDIGLHDLAWDMCWKHYGFFTGAARLENPATAVMAVQPLLNIARLLTRGGDGRQAYAALEQLYQAARQCTAVEVCGRTVDLPAIIRSPEGHRKIAAELWAALLSDGIRALARAGRWAQAAQAAAEHKGVGERLWDGRQVTILALLERGHTIEAAAMVENSEIVDAPEKAVASTMRAFCTSETANPDADCIDLALTEASAMIEWNEPPAAVFRTQLALTTLTLAETSGTKTSHATQLRDALITLAHTDAYAARAVMTALGDDTGSLRLVVEAGGLGRSSPDPGLLDSMTNSVTEAETRLGDLLSTRAA